MKNLIKDVAIVAAIWRLVARYPAATAAVGNIIIVLATGFGLHLTGAELATFASVVAAVFGALVHANVIPLGTHKEAIEAAKSGPKAK